MEEALPGGWKGEGGLVSQDAEGELDGHCVAGDDVDRKASEGEDHGIDKYVEVEVCPRSPPLGAGQGCGILAEDRRSNHMLCVHRWSIWIVVEAPRVGWILRR